MEHDGQRHRLLSLTLLALVLAGCDGDPPPPIDAGRDAGPTCRATADDFPAPVAGHCRSVVRDGAELRAGDDGADALILPGGERVLRVGTTVELGGFPMRVVAVPGTRFVIVSDGGLRDEVLAVLDVDTMAIVDREDFLDERGESLFYGLAVRADGRRVWASGGGTDVVLAYDLDPATGALTPAPSANVPVTAMMSTAYVSGLALRADGLMAIALLRESSVVLWDTTAGAEVRRIGLDAGSMPYDVAFSPDGATLFVSEWADATVSVADVATGAIASEIAVGKNPQALGISPDGATLAVACSDGDVVALIDVATRVVGDRFFVIGESAPRGAAPSAARFGADGRLYVVDALENAIDVLAETAGTWSRVGRIPTMWHPTDVVILEDGTVVFTNGRHVGTGANPTPEDTDITSLMGGSVTALAPGEVADAQLEAWEDEIAANNARMPGLVGVECDPGAGYDFPIPAPDDGEPSAQIRHVIVIVRENKTYDAYLGDLEDASGAPHGDGDPALTLIPGDALAETIPNTRALALAFALADNYYSHAEQSVQGHVWTTMGRTTDFVERTWLTTWGRGHWSTPPQGTVAAGYPEEGSGFTYLDENGITVSNFGEIVGSRGLPLESGYPGLAYSYFPEVDKADYVASRIAGCNLRTFSYLVMPNDHTRGRDPGAPTPESMIADNDEGVGRVIDAISHSTYWPETVVFVIWDDPQDGGDHVDNHRSPLIVASPWARRGHVSSVHASEASVWRTIQLILGLGDVPHSREWDEAAPLYDMFTSTPDYTPYDVIPRRIPEETNPEDGSDMSLLSADYDWSRPDEQPGLSRLLWRYFHDGADAPWRPGVELPFEGDEGEDD